MKRIIILGGGVGGIITANTLRKKLSKQHKIIVIDKEDKHLFVSSLLWVLNGTRTPKAISRPLKTINKKGIEFVHGVIEKVDPIKKEVSVNGEIIKGDYIVVALGADIVDSFDIKDKGFNIYTAEGAEKLNKALSDFKNGKVAVLVTSMPFKCPAAPYESAMLINALLLKKGVSPNIDIYTPEAGPMGVAGKELSGMLRGVVESKGIKFNPELQVSKVDENKLIFSNNSSADYNILAYIPKHQCPQVIKDSPLVDESGWIKLDDRNTLKTKFDKVYAIGDIVNIPLVQGKPLSRAGVFAHFQAQTVANNIAVEINGKGTLKEFTGNGMCFMELGGGKAAFAKGNFYAEPMPNIKMYMPGYYWHWAKILFEKLFLYKWF